MCWGPLMDQNLVVWSRLIRKQRGEKEADIPWFMQKANKAPAWGLLCSQRPQVPSKWGDGTEHLLERVLEARAGKWTQRTSALQRNSLREREREKERERKQDTGTKALMEQRCFIQHCVGIYTVLQDSYFQQRYYHMVTNEGNVWIPQPPGEAYLSS